MAFARLNAQKRRPIKVGIHNDIAAAIPDLGLIEIKRALRFYCSDLRYHRACVAGADRLDLDGNGAGTVTAAQAQNAKRLIAGIEAKLAQRRQHRAKSSAPPAPTAPKRLSLANLREAAAMRKSQGAGQ